VIVASRSKPQRVEEPEALSDVDSEGLQSQSEDSDAMEGVEMRSGVAVDIGHVNGLEGLRGTALFQEYLSAVTDKLQLVDDQDIRYLK
jgi:hypothetical protein